MSRILMGLEVGLALGLLAAPAWPVVAALAVVAALHAVAVMQSISDAKHARDTASFDARDSRTDQKTRDTVEDLARRLKMAEDTIAAMRAQRTMADAFRNMAGPPG